MPQKKNYIRYFTAMTLGVKKNITQLLGYLRQLTLSAIGEMQEWMLMDLTGQQRESIDHLQLMWLSESVARTFSTGEAALRKAERFIVMDNKGRPPTVPPLTPQSTNRIASITPSNQPET